VPLVIDVEADADNFADESYLAANPDVARAVATGEMTAREHFDRYGRAERRRLRNTVGLEAMRRQKFDRITPLLRLDLPHRRIGDKYDFLSDEIRVETGICDTEAVSANRYDNHVIDAIDALPDGLCIRHRLRAARHLF